MQEEKRSQLNGENHEISNKKQVKTDHMISSNWAKNVKFRPFHENITLAYTSQILYFITHNPSSIKEEDRQLGRVVVLRGTVPLWPALIGPWPLLSISCGF
jgi:hypothetical protein